MSETRCINVLKCNLPEIPAIPEIRPKFFETWLENLEILRKITGIRPETL